MADTSRSRTPARSRPTRHATTRATPAPTGTAAVVPVPKRAVPAAAAPLAAGLPVGLGTSTLAADVSGQLRAVAPTLGQVLGSVGTGVADSQAALDKSVTDTVKDLADTNIAVVTDITQYLSDDGEPMPEKTETHSTELSVLNFFMPTIHEWKRVIVSMDLSVGAFSESDGLVFHAHQAGGTDGGVSLFWGFLGLGWNTSDDSSQDMSRSHEQEASWSQGEVRLDATLGPRETGKFPIPSQATVGPQIVFSQGSVREIPVAGAGINRSMDIVVRVLKASGDPNPLKSLTIDAGPLRYSCSTTAPFTGSTTNTEGEIKITVTRNVPNAGAGPVMAPVNINLGTLSKTFTLTI